MTTPDSMDSPLPQVGRVCITLPAQGHAYDEMTSVLAAVVRELGGNVFLVRDGDPAILEADVTILFGRCSLFDASAKLLRAHSSQRPATVLWHVELLPPGVIPAHAEDAARKLVQCDVGRLPKPLRTLVRCVPSHSSVINLVRRIRCAQFVRRCGWDDGPGIGHVHAREWHHAVQNALWLRECYSDAWCDFVAVSTVPRQRLLTEMGIPCEYAPLGHHSLWGTDRGGDRDIDVVFLGNIKRTGRERLVSRVSRQLDKAGVRLLVVDRDCYGEDRMRLLNRAKISLDLVKNTWEMPMLRLLISMACGALVVSNCPVDPYPFREEHLVRVGSDSLASAILEHLRDEPTRRQKVEAARRHLTAELTWRPVVSRVLERALTQHRIFLGASS
ncbi:MAG: glycosyltransferase [Solirubrobacterales bacterium]